MSIKQYTNSGVLVLERPEWNLAGWSKHTGINIENRRELISAYRGIDGTPWPLGNEGLPIINGLVDLKYIVEAIQYYDDVSKLAKCDIIFITANTDGVSCPLSDASVQLIGYDYGYYCGEQNYFSSVIHDCILGCTMLFAYMNKLNNFSLFQSRQEVENYESTRNKLSSEGHNFENDEELLSISIYTLLSKE